MAWYYIMLLDQNILQFVTSRGLNKMAACDATYKQMICHKPETWYWLMQMFLSRVVYHLKVNCWKNIMSPHSMFDVLQCAANKVLPTSTTGYAVYC